MKKNLHTVDRLLRLLLAVVIAVLYFTNSISGTLAVILRISAVALVLTSLIDFCPIYYLFRILSGKKTTHQ
jgi:hypothetical protein